MLFALTKRDTILSVDDSLQFGAEVRRFRDLVYLVKTLTLRTT